MNKSRITQTPTIFYFFGLRLYFPRSTFLRTKNHPNFNRSPKNWFFFSGMFNSVFWLFPVFWFFFLLSLSLLPPLSSSPSLSGCMHKGFDPFNYQKKRVLGVTFHVCIMLPLNKILVPIQKSSLFPKYKYIYIHILIFLLYFNYNKNLKLSCVYFENVISVIYI